MAGSGTYYVGEYFRTEDEARWAVFLEEHDERWNYRRDGQPDASCPRYRPQFAIPARGIFLEVCDQWDTRLRQPDLRRFQEAPEHCVFLAAGPPPTQQQLRARGWWDTRTKRGVLQLSPGIEWDWMFSPANDLVQAAIEAAEVATFDLPIPYGRPPGGPLRDIRPEWNRDR